MHEKELRVMTDMAAFKAIDQLDFGATDDAIDISDEENVDAAFANVIERQRLMPY